MNTIINPRSQKIVSEIDHRALHSFIINKVSVEFANMVENCYYPKIAEIYRDLMHMTNSNEKDLVEYSQLKYPGMETYKLLHDPITTLLILITQEFLKHKDIAGAQSAFHLFALRTYTNSLHRMTTPKGSRQSFCNSDAFQSAFERLSKNHMFVKQKTIPNSILYYSSAMFRMYMKDLMRDNADGIHHLIYALKTRIMQSMKSFFTQYYSSIEENKMSKSEIGEREAYDPSHENKLRGFISKIINDICVYGKIDHEAVADASNLIKFNKKLSEEYAKKLASPAFSERLETALYLLLRDMKDTSFIKSTEFLDYVQKLMSIKVTKQEVYFKKVIASIHLEIIAKLGLDKWYNGLSIQSQAISRNFIAYYLAFVMKKYV